MPIRINNQGLVTLTQGIEDKHEHDDRLPSSYAIFRSCAISWRLMDAG